MYEVLIPSRKFKVSPQNVSIPDYVSPSTGNPFSVPAIIYDGQAHLHVLALIRAISGTAASVEPSASATVRKIIARSRFGQGRIIVTPRGSMFADPAAIRSLLSVVFMDNNSVERSLIEQAIPTRGRHAGIRPKYRTVIDADLYEAIMLSSDKLDGRFTQAQNQIDPRWLEIDARQKIASKKIEKKSEEPVESVEDNNGEVVVDVPSAAPADAGVALAAQLANLSAPSVPVSALAELIKQLSSGKKLIIQVSLD